jgi:hypothetical protein
MTWTKFKTSQSLTDAECNICYLGTPFGTFRIRRNPFTDVYFTYFRNNRLDDKNTLQEAKDYIGELIDSKIKDCKTWIVNEER